MFKIDFVVIFQYREALHPEMEENFILNLSVVIYIQKKCHLVADHKI